MKKETFSIARVSLLTGNLSYKDISLVPSDYEKVRDMPDYIPEYLSEKDKHFLITGVLEEEYRAIFSVPDFKE